MNNKIIAFGILLSTVLSVLSCDDESDNLVVKSKTTICSLKFGYDNNGADAIGSLPISKDGKLSTEYSCSVESGKEKGPQELLYVNEINGYQTISWAYNVRTYDEESWEYDRGTVRVFISLPAVFPERTDTIQVDWYIKSKNSFEVCYENIKVNGASVSLNSLPVILIPVN